MKKIMTIFLLSIVIFASYTVLADDKIMLGSWDFEYTDGNISEYFAQDGRIKTSTTNYAVKNYKIDYVNNSYAFHITGYKESEMPHNAARTFTFKFDEYSLEKYPNTKLVVMFDQQVNEKGATPNYSLHTVSGSDGTYLSMFFLTGINGNFSNPRPNNNGSGAIYVPKGYKDKIVYVFDFEKRELSYTSGGTTKSKLAFYGNSMGNKADTLSFSVNKGEEVVIDNIEVFAVPSYVSAETIDLEDFYFNSGKTSVEFNSPLKSAKASIWKNGTKISDCTVKVNGRVAEIEYKNLEYSKNYTLKITEAVSVFGTALNAEKNYDFSVLPKGAQVTDTNAKDGYNPLENLYFRFDEEVLDASVTIKADGIEFNDFIVNTQNGVEIKYNSAKIFPFDTEINVDMRITNANGVKTLYTYNFKSTTPDENFDVFMKSKNISQAGMGGYSVVALYESDAPGRIYFERDTVNPKVEDDLPFEPGAYVKVINPDGDTYFVSDLTYDKSGKSAFCVEIPQGMKGLWQFQFDDARQGSVLGIGVENASVWGVRGECFIGISENTLKEGYIYVPEIVDSLIAGSTVATDKFTLTDESGNEYSPSSANHAFGKAVVEINNIPGECVYKVTFSDGFYGGFAVDRAPSLICPTKEMAYALKGGWIDTEGILCQGTIQSSARLEALRILNTKNLDVTINKPALPSNIEYPMAEAMLFSPYGLITPLGHQLKRQTLDPSSPFLGNIFDDGVTPSVSWETGLFTPSGNEAVFGAVADLDAQLNYFYGNKALANRCALMILSSIIQMSEDSIIREGDNALHYPTTHGNFYFHWITEGYESVRHLLDEETVRVIDNGLMAMADKQGTFRGMNTTNQWFFTVAAVDSVARATNSERHHDLFKTHINGLYTNDVYKQRLGQATNGYFVEGYGCDGQYHNLCQLLLYATYRNYREWAGADAKTVKQLDEIIAKNVEFNSLFWLPQPTLESYLSANCFTSRTDTGYAITTHTNYEFLTDLFPVAKRRLETSNMPESGIGSAGTFAYRVTNDEWAMRVIKKYYPVYENYTKNYTAHGSKALYNAFKNQYNTKSEPLPCEYEQGLWDKSGIIALKHKDLYLNVFYAFEDETSLPSMSYLGGGMTNVWSQETGTVVSSQKPVNYSAGVNSSDQVRSSCVYGTDSSGKFFMSGKEISTLKWIEKDKIFEISGTIPDKNIKIVWRYELTEKGIKVTVNATGNVSDDLWVNIPLITGEPKSIVEYYDGKALFGYNNNVVSFTTENETDYFENGNIKNFRIKLKNNSATFDMQSYKTAKIEISDITESGYTVSAKVETKTGKTEKVLALIGAYKNSGELLQAHFYETEIIPDEENYVFADLYVLNADYVKVFIWESLKTMQPYACEKYDL